MADSDWVVLNDGYAHARSLDGWHLLVTGPAANGYGPFEWQATAERGREYWRCSGLADAQAARAVAEEYVRDRAEFARLRGFVLATSPARRGG